MNPIDRIVSEHGLMLLDGAFSSELERRGCDLNDALWSAKVLVIFSGAALLVFFTAHLLEKAGIVTTPGNGFGAPGEGYVRMTVCTTKERLAEAVERIKKVGF